MPNFYFYFFSRWFAWAIHWNEPPQFGRASLLVDEICDPCTCAKQSPCSECMPAEEIISDSPQPEMVILVCGVVA